MGTDPSSWAQEIFSEGIWHSSSEPTWSEPWGCCVDTDVNPLCPSGGLPVRRVNVFSTPQPQGFASANVGLPRAAHLQRLPQEGIKVQTPHPPGATLTDHSSFNLHHDPLLPLPMLPAFPQVWTPKMPPNQCREQGAPRRTQCKRVGTWKTHHPWELDPRTAGSGRGGRRRRRSQPWRAGHVHPQEGRTVWCEASGDWGVTVTSGQLRLSSAETGTLTVGEIHRRQWGKASEAQRRGQAGASPLGKAENPPAPTIPGLGKRHLPNCKEDPGGGARGRAGLSVGLGVACPGPNWWNQRAAAFSEPPTPTSEILSSLVTCCIWK